MKGCCRIVLFCSLYCFCCVVADYAEPGAQAPFDFDPEDMKVMSNEERIKKGIKEQHERIRKVLSPQALKLMELEK